MTQVVALGLHSTEGGTPKAVQLQREPVSLWTQHLARGASACSGGGTAVHRMNARGMVTSRLLCGRDYEISRGCRDWVVVDDMVKICVLWLLVGRAKIQQN